MKNNKGMSLVELLITVTILAIVIISAATFMVTGSRSFAKGSADSDVQGEAELAVNQIEDLVIDVNGGVDYVKDDAANTESLVMYHTEPDNSGVSVNKKRNVTWNKSDNKIYSSEWVVTKDSSTGLYVETSTVYSDELLAENVMDFNVDLSDIIKETDKDGNDIDIVRSVVIRVDCKDGTGRSAYATTPIITLRNRMMLSGSPEAIFENTPTADDTLLLYISDVGMEMAVPIRDRVTTVERGKMYNIYAMVSAGTNVNSLCDWQVEGEASGHLSQMNVSGVFAVLDVDISEPNDYLVITASYKDNPSKKAVGIVKVIGGDSKSLDSTNIIPQSLKTYSAEFDSRTFCTNFSSDEWDALQYQWTILDGAKMFESFASTNSTLNLKLIKEEENYNKVVKIRLDVYSPTTNQTVSDIYSYRTDPAQTVNGDSLMERGKVGYVNGFHKDNWYTFKPPLKEGDSNFCELVGYDFYVCDIYGKKIDEKDYLKQYVIIDVNGGITKPLNGGMDISYWLTLDKDLPADQEFYLKVLVYFKYNDGTEWNYERIHYVSAVHLYGESTEYKKLTDSNGAFNADTSFEFFYELTGYYSNTWATNKPDAFDYDITFEYEAPEGVTIEPRKYDWGTNVANGKRIRGSAGFQVTNNSGREWYQVKFEVKMKRAVVKVYMKEYPSVYTYCYVDFE